LRFGCCPVTWGQPVGINCRFGDEFGNLKTFLLALPQQLGQHSGVNIADQITAVIEHFNISESISYFMTDNATNNDTCIEALGLEYNFNPSTDAFAALAIRSTL
jgi:hypothetical protein